MHKRDRSRFWVALFLNDLREGEVFEPGLLHITLLPWLVSDKLDSEVVDSFKTKFNDFEILSLMLDSISFFGPEKDVPVALISPTSEIENLHEACLQWFREISGRWAVKNPYVGKDFRPHIRIRGEYNPVVGEQLSIKSIYLIKAARAEDGERVVVAKEGRNE